MANLFLLKWLNRENPAAIVIQINGAVDKNNLFIPFQKTELWKPKKIRLFKCEKKELVENFLRLKENNAENSKIHPEVLAIKEFYVENYVGNNTEVGA